MKIICSTCGCENTLVRSSVSGVLECKSCGDSIIE